MKLPRSIKKRKPDPRAATNAGMLEILDETEAASRVRASQAHTDGDDEGFWMEKALQAHIGRQREKVQQAIMDGSHA
jgi:hypothetical protein